MAIRLSHQPTNFLFFFFSVFYIVVIPQYNNIDFTVAYSDLLSYDGDRHYLCHGHKFLTIDARQREMRANVDHAKWYYVLSFKI